jgi:hypothetical protein
MDDADLQHIITLAHMVLGDVDPRLPIEVQLKALARTVLWLTEAPPVHSPKPASS